MLVCCGSGRVVAKLSLQENAAAEPTMLLLVMSTNFAANEHLITNCLYTPTRAVSQRSTELIYKHPVNLDARSWPVLQ